MGGSGSGYRFEPGELEERRREVDEAVKRGRQDAEINALLGEKLVDLNQRDTDQVSKRLDEIREALADQLQEFDRLLFGGSVAKQTYVEGLSDVDSLVVLKVDALSSDNPAQLLKEFEKLLRSKLNMGEVREIRTGLLAATVVYKDGPEIQLLPAVERGKELAISAPSGRDWTEVQPRRFAANLTEVNTQQAGAVVPAVKLAKAIIGHLPESEQLSGYHVEALAVAAFDGYTGPRNPKAMVTRFFESAAKNVRQPAADITGQSRHVDEALGGANSQERSRRAHRLGRIARTLENSSIRSWRRLLGDE